MTEFINAKPDEGLIEGINPSTCDNFIRKFNELIVDDEETPSITTLEHPELRLTDQEFIHCVNKALKMGWRLQMVKLYKHIQYTLTKR